jgi:hypothetical protein
MARLLASTAVVLGLLIAPSAAAPAAASWAGSAAGSATAAATTLAPPGTLTGTCDLLLDASVRLDWGASASTWADGYEVRWGTASGGPYPNSSGVVTGLTYATPALGLGTHYFVVAAAKGSWRSAPSNQVSKTVILILFVAACS